MWEVEGCGRRQHRRQRWAGASYCQKLVYRVAPLVVGVWVILVSAIGVEGGKKAAREVWEVEGCGRQSGETEECGRQMWAGVSFCQQ